MWMRVDLQERRIWFALGIAIIPALALFSLPRQTPAKEDNSGDRPPAEALRNQAAETAAEEAATEEIAPEGSKEPEVESFLAWVVRCSGLIGLVILLLSIYFVSTVGRLFWEIRIPMAAPPELTQHCESLLEQGDFKGIFNIVKEGDSFFARLLTTGIRELPNGLAEARDAMERLGEAITAEMEKKISMLAVIGTLGPMIGLLGTLKGMITSFSVIARSDVQLKASEVARGISEALLLTFEGVALSVPAIYFFALFRNRIIHISSSVILLADQFLRHFSHAGRARAGSTTPPARPT